MRQFRGRALVSHHWQLGFFPRAFALAVVRDLNIRIERACGVSHPLCKRMSPPPTLPVRVLEGEGEGEGARAYR